MKTSTSIALAVVIIGSSLLIASGALTRGADGGTNENVSMVDGTQVIAINAGGGYHPRITLAKAGVPTVIKLNTVTTFDCSSSVVIPSIGYQKNLPHTGETLIEVPPQKAGTSMQGLCGMGMYNFTIKFD